MENRKNEGRDFAADTEAYCTYCKKEVAIDSDDRCLECKWPIEEQSELRDPPGDQDNSAKSATRPKTALIWWFSLLAIPLGFCGFIFLRGKPFMWLRTPLRLAPYAAASGSLIMLIFQSLNQPRVRFSLLFVVLTGLLSGVLGAIVLVLIFVITRGGVVH